MGAKHPLYDTWYAMKRRCQDPTHVAYKRYGGKGITVCPEWQVFSIFAQDMGERPEGLTLERKDNTKGYSPDNCVWATRAEQSANRGAYTTNVTMTHNGETLSIREWATKLGTTERTIWRRYQRFGKPVLPGKG